MRHTFTLNDEQHGISSSDELAAWLEKVRQLDRADISLYQVVGFRKGFEAVLCRMFGSTTKIEGKVLMAWLNGNLAYLIFEEDDDQSFHSYNPLYSGAEGAQAKFFLGGEEENISPSSWCISRDEALKSVMYFYEYVEKPEWIHWQKD